MWAELSFPDLQVPILNARTRELVLTQGTELGTVYKAGTIRPPSLNRIRENLDESSGVVEQMMVKLDPELDDEQRSRIHALLKQYQSILSTNDHDIGRTHLVEHTIDTGNHRPIRPPLRRQPFQHQDFIDEETKRMLEYGIIEPAVSSWASNVVLVKKRTDRSASV